MHAANVRMIKGHVTEPRQSTLIQVYTNLAVANNVIKLEDANK